VRGREILMEETRERIIFSCKNWGNENCNPEVGTLFAYNKY